MSGVNSNALRYVGEVAYRAGLGPRPSGTPDKGLIDAVGGQSRRRPGRALDLGCGTGRNAIYLARHGWEVTGVEMVGHELSVARRNAAAVGVAPRLLRGDVTRLAELDIGDGYTLLMDGGCYHMVPQGRRDAYAASVTEVSASGALLIMVGFTRVLGSGMDSERIRARFRGWELTAAEPIPGQEMQRYVAKPAPLKAGLAKGWFGPWRYQLQRH
ncbi:MAG: class I SAM-dependent methyltransferase [Pseudonocardiaceae bacterium]